ncbi:MAG: hypothetical protein LBP68_08090, partial [Acidobacteriota bacterium]|nr:hypothetical protein [Acidobacteriota bacterium]
MQKDTGRLQAKFREGRASLFQNVSWSEPGLDLLRANAALTDEILKEIHLISCRAADQQAPRSGRSGLAIIATGGYGRRELNPFSDVDIAFVPSDEDDPWVEALIHNAFKLVMEVFPTLRDIHVGYAFRPVSDAGVWDVVTKTALLDARHICGDTILTKKLEIRIREVLSPLDILLESPEGNIPAGLRTRPRYSVEPNLKEHPGALRDLHRARWIFKLLFNVEDCELETALRERAGISSQQIADVRAAAEWFWRARTWLHLASGKPNDVLIGNYQDRIAGELGQCSSQEWLALHLGHSETLADFREAAVRTLAQGPFRMNGARLQNGYLHLQGNAPGSSSAVRMLRVSQRYNLHIGLQDLKQLDDARGLALEVDTPAKEEIRSFLEILGDAGQGVSSVIRTMLRFGLLDRFVPGFSDVMRYVPPDPAHSFTVGEHSLQIIEVLERLSQGRDGESRRFAELLEQCGHFDMLALAALVHDVGKLQAGTEHCESGADFARTVASRLNLAPEKRELLDVLVRQHLLLVRTARLQDLQSANVIQSVAEKVPSMEALRHLYLFTYADTQAVGVKNWTSMDFRDLEDLYSKMRTHYDGVSIEFSKVAPAAQSQNAPNAQTTEKTQKNEDQQSVLIRKKIAALQARNDPAVMKHCETMPPGYVLNTPLEDIAFHLQLLHRLESEPIVLDVYNRPGDDYSELTICAQDDPAPGMLAKITGVLYGSNIDIHRARAFTTTERGRRIILDTLWVRCNGMQISEYRARKVQ